ncbi:MAG: ABC transporter ATP-binding protein [Gemmatimonadales bacterium]|nr:MAG: ABC transporter ATP-binding protein [Gemmatimonadales bacterium]
MSDGGAAVAERLPLEARDLVRTYPSGDGSELHILRGVSLRLQRGEAIAVVGTSGAGKSTLLHLLGALDRPSSGEVILGGESVSGRSSAEVARIRNRFVGFVFQFHHLLREFSALENASMPALVGGANPDEARERARGLLEGVGMGHRLDHRPWQLSGGEQQRVAVARALMNGPSVLLADEPSGNLDTRTSEELHDMLFRVRDEQGCALVVVTHNPALAARADRILTLRSGVLVSEEDPRMEDKHHAM